MTTIEFAVAYLLVSLIGVIAGRAIGWFFMLPLFGNWTHAPSPREVLNSFSLLGFPIGFFAGFAFNQLAFGNAAICLAILAGHLLVPCGLGAFKVLVNIIAWVFDKIDAKLRGYFGNIN